ncbi:hypothetical protein E1262_09135 [Jiangella aurantiaca]|uniref:Uncharacterized protein n=1 Tax=Jiangella aurantiaca TaxID=2530373 RepID=A0A4R5AD97_9ACTN|nr:hypothetical protein [Jiangella aurantiaca]TDD70403.1 hypothetical protein E1262_09135 [Jiangella aurantiaca]
MSRMVHVVHGPTATAGTPVRPDHPHDVVVPGWKPDPPNAAPWHHDSSAGTPRAGFSQAGDPLHAGPPAAVPEADPRLSATVHGEHHTGLLRVRLAGDGGDAAEYELDVEQALQLSQRLRDAAVAMQEFLSAPKTFGAGRDSR